MRAGIILDWEGVLFETQQAFRQSWLETAMAFDRTLRTGNFQHAFGRSSKSIAREFMVWSSDPEELRHISTYREEMFRRIIRESGELKLLPGARRWLDGLRKCPFQRAIASCANRITVQFVLDYGGVRQDFDIVVTGDDVTRGEPEPDLLLAAAQKLGLAPARCLVIEGTRTGVEAALNAGMKVIAVAHRDSQLWFSGADRVIESVAELGLEEMDRLMGEEERGDGIGITRREGAPVP